MKWRREVGELETESAGCSISDLLSSKVQARAENSHLDGGLFSQRKQSQAHTGRRLLGEKKSCAFFRNASRLFFLNAAGVTIGAGEVGILSIDVDEIVAHSADLVQIFSTALGQDEVAGFASAGLNRPFSVGRTVIAIMTAEASVPIGILQ